MADIYCNIYTQCQKSILKKNLATHYRTHDLNKELSQKWYQECRVAINRHNWSRHMSKHNNNSTKYYNQYSHHVSKAH
jgi:hypothetical protein